MRVNGTGWKKRVRNKGAAYPLTCRNCEKQVAYELILARYWITFLWIPVLPISRQSQYLSCPNCEATFEITDGEEVNYAREATKYTPEYLQNTMDTKEYWETVGPIMENSSFVEVPAQADSDNNNPEHPPGFQ